MEQLPLLLVPSPTCHCTQIRANCCRSPNCNQTDKRFTKTYRGSCADYSFAKFGNHHSGFDHILGRFLRINFTRSHPKVLLWHPAPAKEPQREARTLQLKRIRDTNYINTLLPTSLTCWPIECWSWGNRPKVSLCFQKWSQLISFHTFWKNSKTMYQQHFLLSTCPREWTQNFTFTW